MSQKNILSPDVPIMGSSPSLLSPDRARPVHSTLASAQFSAIPPILHPQVPLSSSIPDMPSNPNVKVVKKIVRRRVTKAEAELIRQRQQRDREAAAATPPPSSAFPHFTHVPMPQTGVSVVDDKSKGQHASSTMATTYSTNTNKNPHTTTNTNTNSTTTTATTTARATTAHAGMHARAPATTMIHNHTSGNIGHNSGNIGHNSGNIGHNSGTHASSHHGSGIGAFGNSFIPNYVSSPSSFPPSSSSLPLTSSSTPSHLNPLPPSSFLVPSSSFPLPSTSMLSHPSTSTSASASTSTFASNLPPPSHFPSSSLLSLPPHLPPPSHHPSHHPSSLPPHPLTSPFPQYTQSTRTPARSTHTHAHHTPIISQQSPISGISSGISSGIPASLPIGNPFAATSMSISKPIGTSTTQIPGNTIFSGNIQISENLEKLENSGSVSPLRPTTGDPTVSQLGFSSKLLSQRPAFPRTTLSLLPLPGAPPNCHLPIPKPTIIPAPASSSTTSSTTLTTPTTTTASPAVTTAVTNASNAAVTATSAKIHVPSSSNASSSNASTLSVTPATRHVVLAAHATTTNISPLTAASTSTSTSTSATTSSSFTSASSSSSASASASASATTPVLLRALGHPTASATTTPSAVTTTPASTSVPVPVPVPAQGVSTNEGGGGGAVTGADNVGVGVGVGDSVGGAGACGQRAKKARGKTETHAMTVEMETSLENTSNVWEQEDEREDEEEDEGERHGVWKSGVCGRRGASEEMGGEERVEREGGESKVKQVENSACSRDEEERRKGEREENIWNIDEGDEHLSFPGEDDISFTSSENTHIPENEEITGIPGKSVFSIGMGISSIIPGTARGTGISEDIKGVMFHNNTDISARIHKVPEISKNPEIDPVPSVVNDHDMDVSFPLFDANSFPDILDGNKISPIDIDYNIDKKSDTSVLSSVHEQPGGDITADVDKRSSVSITSGVDKMPNTTSLPGPILRQIRYDDTDSVPGVDKTGMPTLSSVDNTSVHSMFGVEEISRVDPGLSVAMVPAAAVVSVPGDGSAVNSDMSSTLHTASHIKVPSKVPSDAPFNARSGSTVDVGSRAGVSSPAFGSIHHLDRDNVNEYVNMDKSSAVEMSSCSSVVDMPITSAVAMSSCSSVAMPSSLAAASIGTSRRNVASEVHPSGSSFAAACVDTSGRHTPSDGYLSSNRLGRNHASHASNADGHPPSSLAPRPRVDNKDVDVASTLYPPTPPPDVNKHSLFDMTTDVDISSPSDASGDGDGDGDAWGWAVPVPVNTRVHAQDLRVPARDRGAYDLSPTRMHADTPHQDTRHTGMQDTLRPQHTEDTAAVAATTSTSTSATTAATTTTSSTATATTTATTTDPVPVFATTTATATAAPSGVCTAFNDGRANTLSTTGVSDENNNPHVEDSPASPFAGDGAIDTDTIPRVPGKHPYNVSGTGVHDDNISSAPYRTHMDTRTLIAPAICVAGSEIISRTGVDEVNINPPVHRDHVDRSVGVTSESAHMDTITAVATTRTHTHSDSAAMRAVKDDVDITGCGLTSAIADVGDIQLSETCLHETRGSDTPANTINAGLSGMGVSITQTNTISAVRGDHINPSSFDNPSLNTSAPLLAVDRGDVFNASRHTKLVPALVQDITRPGVGVNGACGASIASLGDGEDAGGGGSGRGGNGGGGVNGGSDGHVLRENESNRDGVEGGVKGGAEGGADKVRENRNDEAGGGGGSGGGDRRVARSKHSAMGISDAGMRVSGAGSKASEDGSVGANTASDESGSGCGMGTMYGVNSGNGGGNSNGKGKKGARAHVDGQKTKKKHVNDHGPSPYPHGYPYPHPYPYPYQYPYPPHIPFPTHIHNPENGSNSQSAKHPENNPSSGNMLPPFPGVYPHFPNPYGFPFPNYPPYPPNSYPILTDDGVSEPQSHHQHQYQHQQHQLQQQHQQHPQQQHNYQSPQYQQHQHQHQHIPQHAPQGVVTASTTVSGKHGKSGISDILMSVPVLSPTETQPSGIRKFPTIVSTTTTTPVTTATATATASMANTTNTTTPILPTVTATNTQPPLFFTPKQMDTTRTASILQPTSLKPPRNIAGSPVGIPKLLENGEVPKKWNSGGIFTDELNFQTNTTSFHRQKSDIYGGIVESIGLTGLLSSFSEKSGKSGKNDKSGDPLLDISLSPLDVLLRAIFMGDACTVEQILTSNATTEEENPEKTLIPEDIPYLSGNSHFPENFTLDIKQIPLRYYPEYQWQALLHSSTKLIRKIPIAKLALQYGADVNKPDTRAKTSCLILAVQFGPRPVWRFLLSHNADVRHGSHMFNCIQQAVVRGNLEFIYDCYYRGIDVEISEVAQLIEHADNTRVQEFPTRNSENSGNLPYSYEYIDSGYGTPLQFALAMGQYQTFLRLIAIGREKELGISISENSAYNPLHPGECPGGYESEEDIPEDGKPEFSSRTILSGKSVSQRNRRTSPIHLSETVLTSEDEFLPETAGLFIPAKYSRKNPPPFPAFSVNPTPLHRNRSLLHEVTCLPSFSLQTTLITSLIRAKAAINAQDDEGNSCLLLAVQNGHVAVSEVLLSHGANVWVCNNEGMNAVVACLLSPAARTDTSLFERLLVYAEEQRQRYVAYISLIQRTESIMQRLQGTTQRIDSDLALIQRCEGDTQRIEEEIVVRGSTISDYDDHHLTSREFFFTLYNMLHSIENEEEKKLFLLDFDMMRQHHPLYNEYTSLYSELSYITEQEASFNEFDDKTRQNMLSGMNICDVAGEEGLSASSWAMMMARDALPKEREVWIQIRTLIAKYKANGDVLSREYLINERRKEEDREKDVKSKKRDDEKEREDGRKIEERTTDDAREKVYRDEEQAHESSYEEDQEEEEDEHWNACDDSAEEEEEEEEEEGEGSEEEGHGLRVIVSEDEEDEEIEERNEGYEEEEEEEVEEEILYR